MTRPPCDDTCTVDCGSCKGGGPAAREAYRRRFAGGSTLDTGGPGPVVGDHYGTDGVHRVFRDASPLDPITHFRIDQRIGLVAAAETARPADWLHPYLPRPLLDRYPDKTRERLQRMAATPQRAALVAAYTAEQDSASPDARLADQYDVPLTARDQLVIALAAAAVAGLVLRTVARRWWWTA